MASIIPNDTRKESLLRLRNLYIAIDDPADVRAIEVAMYALTEPLFFHGEMLGRDWNYPCMCYECRTSV
jgi:hypothetical protein